MESIKQFGGNMNKFNAGDKVICKDVSGFDMSHLELDKVYEVQRVVGVDISLVGVEYTTKVWRFELYKEKPDES